MKRFFAFIFAMILLILPISMSYAAFTFPFVSRLATASATAAGSGGVRIPARVTGVTSTGSNVAGWVSLLLPATATARIACLGLGVAGSLAADYLINAGSAWLDSQGISRAADGTYQKTTTALIPDGHTASDYINPDAGLMGFFALEVSASAACDAAYQAAYDSLKSIYPPYTFTNRCGSDFNAEVGWKIYGYTQSGKPWSYFYFYYPRPGSPKPPSHSETYNNPFSLNAIESSLVTSLTSGDKNAQLMALASLDVASAALDNSSHPMNLNQSIRDAMQLALAGSLTPEQLSNLEAGATPNVGDQVLPDDEPNINDLTPAQIADAVRVALAGQGLSSAQIAAAIAAAQQAAAAGLSAAEAQTAVANALALAGLSSTAIAQATATALTAAGVATNAGVETAVKNALNDETGVIFPVDPDILLPNKLSLTAVLETFISQIQELPMFQTLSGLTIQTDGTSQLCLNDVLGASYCYDASHMQSTLNMIGSAILGLVSLISFVNIFRG